MPEQAAPFYVPSGWEWSEYIDHVAGPTYRLLGYPDGEVRFEHRCDRGERGVIICAPALQIGNGHTLTWNELGQPTVRASILCPDCGTHGFITDGRWSE